MKITIIGWEKGFKKVSFNQFLREQYGYSIKESKDIVDKILNEERVTLHVDQTEGFEKKAARYGIVYELNESK